jgi:hypothetical protein
MSLRTVIQKKFQNLFVAVILNESESILRCKVLKDGVIKKTFTKTFTQTQPSDALESSVENYLIALHDEYAFVYIAFFLGTMGQGAIEGMGKSAFSKHNVDMDNVFHVPMNKQWSAYASYIEIKWAKNLFSEVGLDLIFSPFMVLNDFVVSQKLKNKPTCYLLNAEDCFCVAIMDGKNLHFGAFFKTQSDATFSNNAQVSDWENEEKEEGITALGDITELNDEYDHDDLSDLGELGDIDEFKSVDSFSDVDEPKSLGHFKGLDTIREEDTSLELYGRDLLVYKYLKSSLEEYYHNPVYESAFIEEIIIFDGYEISSDLIRQLEDELMMDVEIHKVDISDRVCDIAIKEVFA